MTWKPPPSEALTDKQLMEIVGLIFRAREKIDAATEDCKCGCAGYAAELANACAHLHCDLIDARNRQTWEGFKEYIKTPTVTDETVRLRAVVDRLPLTMDGVRVVPFLDTLWLIESGKISNRGPGWLWECYTPGYGWETLRNDEGGCSKSRVPVSDCYSTRMAAEAAMKGTP